MKTRWAESLKKLREIGKRIEGKEDTLERKKLGFFVTERELDIIKMTKQRKV